MRIFVAGATGAIGRDVVPLLLSAGHEVHAVGRTAEKRLVLERSGAIPVSLDLFDAAAVRGAVRGMDIVVNLATAVPRGYSVFLPWAWREMTRIRRVASANFVAAALQSDTITRIVQESFAPIYEDGGDTWLNETAPVRPASYNRAILDAEAAAGRFTGRDRVGVVLRFGLFYGPDDAITEQLVGGVRQGRLLLFGRPDGYVSSISHADAAGAVVSALAVSPGIYNVVDDQPLTRRQMGDGIAHLVGATPPRLLPAWATRLGGSVAETISRSLRISNRRFRQAAGWSPTYPSMLDGLAGFGVGRQTGDVRQAAIELPRPDPDAGASP